MNKINLSKLVRAGVAGAIATTAIMANPAQAIDDPSTLEWDNGTDSFIGEVDLSDEDNVFDVLFSPLDAVAVFIATGHFEPFFDVPELVDLVPSGGVLGTFENEFIVDPDDLPPGVVAEAEYELLEDLMFTFDTDGSGDVSDGDVMATLPSGSMFLGEEILDGAVEFELVVGEWEFKIPAFGDTPEKTVIAESSIMEFGQTVASPGGAFLAEGTVIKTPEPGTILGLLAIGGLGLGLKRKKQS